jgi:hypothetical protein
MASVESLMSSMPQRLRRSTDRRGQCRASQSLRVPAAPKELRPVVVGEIEGRERRARRESGVERVDANGVVGEIEGLEVGAERQEQGERGGVGELTSQISYPDFDEIELGALDSEIGEHVSVLVRARPGVVLSVAEDILQGTAARVRHDRVAQSPGGLSQQQLPIVGIRDQVLQDVFVVHRSTCRRSYILRLAHMQRQIL